MRMAWICFKSVTKRSNRRENWFGTLITARAPNVTRLFLPRIPNKRSTVDEEEQNTHVILSKILSPLQKLEVLDLSYWSKTDDMRCLQSLSNTLTCLILYDVPDLYHAISNICHMTEIRWAEWLSTKKVCDLINKLSKIT